jgi:UTP--glucose-1-phosphate uridylyltransferase
VAQFEATRGSIIAVQEVPAEHTRRYGIVAGNRRRRPAWSTSPDRRKAAATSRRRAWASPAAYC